MKTWRRCDSEQASHFALISDIGYIDYEAQLGADECVCRTAKYLHTIKDEST